MRRGGLPILVSVASVFPFREQELYLVLRGARGADTAAGRDTAEPPGVGGRLWDEEDGALLEAVWD